MKTETQGLGLRSPGQWLLIALAVLIATLAPLPSWATPIGTAQLRISDGTTTVVLTDSDGDGVITFNGSIGNFGVVVSTGISKPTLGDATAPHLDLSSIQVTGSMGGSLTISFTDTDFTQLSPGSYTSMIGGSCTSCTGTFSSYLDTSNSAFGTGTLLAQTSFGPGAFSPTFTSDDLAVVSPYSVTEIVNVSLPVSFLQLEKLRGSVPLLSQSASFNAEVYATPEPQSLVLVGSGMACLGLVAFRRSRKQKASI
jgi:hypothetical protein